MSRRLTVLVTACLLGLAGCNSDGDDTPPNSSQPPTSAATESAPDGSASPAADYRRAEAALKQKDYDTAIPLMESLGDFRDARARAAGFRSQAAKATLAEARTKIVRAPRAAVSLTETSLRYESTPQAEAFLRRAKAALERFKKRGQDDQSF